LKVTGKNSLNKTLRNIDIETMIVSLVLLFGFYYGFAIINQSQAIKKDTLNVPLSTNINADSSIIRNDNNVTQSFHVAYEMLINDSHGLTQSYQKEIGKWISKQYDNKTMILITDKSLPEFQKLVSRMQALQPTTAKYLQAKDLYIKSLQSEIGSYMHFRNFLITGNKTEDDTSIQLLSNALKYEISSFTAFNNRTVTDTDNNFGNKSFLPA
jgi:multidrug efflux pump subunit AcrB